MSKTGCLVGPCVDAQTENVASDFEDTDEDEDEDPTAGFIIPQDRC